MNISELKCQVLYFSSNNHHSDPSNKINAFSLVRSAFTMIELLVVIAIISILMTLLLPALNKAKKMADRAVCANNMKQLGIGYYEYDSDFSRLPALLPELFPDDQPNGGGCYLKYNYNSQGNWIGFGMLYKAGYIKNAWSFYCPSKMNQQHTPVDKSGTCSYYGRGSSGLGKWDPDIDSPADVIDNYWQRWNGYTRSYETSTLEPGDFCAVMRSHLTQNSGNRWLAVDMYGFYVAGLEDRWMPHPSGVNILCIDNHVTFYPTSLAQMSVFHSSQRPSRVCNYLLDTAGQTNP